MAEGALLHQVHPAKIGADVAASIISNVLLFREKPTAAVAVRCVLPIAGSAAVLGMADLDALARTRRGRYVLAHMPPAAQAARLAGDALMGFGAYRRNPTLFAAGAAVVLLGWSHGFWTQRFCPRSPIAGVVDWGVQGVRGVRGVQCAQWLMLDLSVYPISTNCRTEAS